MRLFVAAWPPPEVVAELQAFPRPVVPGIRWTTAEQWHVTLSFLGEVAEDAVGGLVAALEAATSDAAPAPAVAGPHAACLGRSVLVVPISGLEALAAATVAATLRAGAGGRDGRPFVGHLTLARSRRNGPDLRSFSGRLLAGSWTVSDITLVRSRTESTGARYEVVRRFPLPPGH